MAVYDLYSKRKRQAEGSRDVYQYERVSTKLRVQLIQILKDGFGSIRGDPAWSGAADILRREYGLHQLVQHASSSREELRAFIELCNVDQFIDTVEVVCRVLEFVCSESGYGGRYYNEAKDVADACVDEINVRMREASFGFEYRNGTIVRVDAQYVHAEAVLPALDILQLDSMYSGSEAEFLKAHTAYRNGDASTALIESCKSFESMMKAICDKRHWPYDKDRDTASKLVGICLANELVPSYWQTNFTGLRQILESALPTPRNRTSGHGSGSAPVVVPLELARYVLHMTAATLLFLAEAEKALP